MTSLTNLVSDEHMEIIRQVYTGINRDDIDFVLSLMNTDVTRVEPEGFPTAGTYRGYVEMRKHLNTGRNTWAEGSCEPVGFVAVGDKIVVTVHIKVRLKDHSEWIDARIADGFIIKDGLVTNFHSFLNNEKVIEWALLTLS